jgi:hypothetical protein
MLKDRTKGREKNRYQYMSCTRDPSPFPLCAHQRTFYDALKLLGNTSLLFLRILTTRR